MTKQYPLKETMCGLFALALLILSGCGTSDPANYEKVFPQDRVNRIDITIAPDQWQRMTAEMETNYGPFGAGKGLEEDVFWEEVWPDRDLPDQDPIWVPCTVRFEDNTWNYVGIRFKGALTLFMSWWRGSYKIPFKLDFDQFEERYPETKNQRFYGFKKISFSNNMFDPILLRYKVAADLFREDGVPSPHTAFYRVFIDNGSGSIYFGLYSAAEVPGATMFIDQFGGEGGNLYKPYSDSPSVWREEGPASDLFPEKTGKSPVDYSDINEAVAVLNSDRSDAQAWRENLERELDAYSFLQWLAIDAVLENWDVSGNYYVYSDPGEGGRLNWIPWDFDSFFAQHDISEHIDDFFGAPLTLDMTGVTENPLIRYLLDDPLYNSAYIEAIRHFRDNAFSKEPLKARFQALHDLIAPYVIGPEGELADYTYTDESSFESGLDDLFDYIDNRHFQIATFLGD
jgi:spore coat protein H